MADTHDNLRCPNCQSLMQAGFLPVSKGMHFIRGDGRAASHFAEDIPGTHAIMRTNRLLAWRCKACRFIVFKYGRDSAKTIERLLEDDAISADELAAQIEAIEEEDPRA
ncbi:MAG: PF20097 family protein [Phycisphaeraceae bacterium]